jgi:hypothetical protein
MTSSMCDPNRAAAMYTQQSADTAAARQRRLTPQPVLVGYCADSNGNMRAYYQDGTSTPA